MNERILSPQLLKLVQAAGPGYSQANPEWVKKFAELIVRECAGVCDDERDSNDSEFGKLVAEICALKIMERFGVEQ